MNVNFGSNFGKGAPTSTSTNSNAIQTSNVQQSSETQISHQNLTTQSSMNLLTERMMNTAMSMNSMNVKQLAALLRELLSLPKEMHELLAMLAFGENTTGEIANKIKDPTLQLIIKQLQNLLGQNSKDAINKLIQLTQNNALFFEGSSQLRDILGLIQKIAVTAQTSPADALTMAMVLYLPWLPLAEQQKLELSFGFKEEEENSEKIECEVLILFIQTLNIGIFKITIMLNNDKSIDIEIESDKIDAKVIENIVAATNKNLKATGLKSKVATSTRKEAQYKSPKEMKTETNKSISLHPSGKISMVTINIGHSIAKLIFETDEKIGSLK